MNRDQQLSGAGILVALNDTLKYLRKQFLLTTSCTFSLVHGTNIMIIYYIITEMRSLRISVSYTAVAWQRKVRSSTLVSYTS